eukprot:1239671-Alexandrium_andersonii.AAC.1
MVRVSISLKVPPARSVFAFCTGASPIATLSSVPSRSVCVWQRLRRTRRPCRHAASAEVRRSASTAGRP